MTAKSKAVWTGSGCTIRTRCSCTAPGSMALSRTSWSHPGSTFRTQPASDSATAASKKSKAIAASYFDPSCSGLLYRVKTTARLYSG